VRFRALVIGALFAAVVGGTPPVAVAQALTQEEALELAFPGAEVERRTAYLEPGQLQRARELAGGDVDIESEIVTHYVANRDGKFVGVAYFDAHIVRTHREVLMIVVAPDATVRRIETVAFREPPEYEAPEGWLDLFQERPLDRDLSLKGEIPPMTGATLTAVAVTRSARRVLALHAVIDPASTANR